MIPETGLAYVPIFGEGIHALNPNPGHTLWVIDLMKRARRRARSQRRRRRSPLSKRRPRFLARRRTGVTRLGSLVHREEREIIARN